MAIEKWKIGVPSQQWVKIRTELWFTGVDLKGNVSSYTNQIKVNSLFCVQEEINKRCGAYLYRYGAYLYVCYLRETMYSNQRMKWISEIVCMYIVPGNEFLTYLAGKSLYHA